MRFRPHALTWRLTLATLFAAAIASAPLLDGQEPKPGGNTHGIKRVALPNEAKLAELLKTEETLIEFPLMALDARLNRIAAGGQVAPRLVKAVYRAGLQGNHLAQGTGSWAVEHSGNSPAILPLPGFNLALNRPRMGGEEAVLGEFPGANFGLLVRKPGSNSFEFEWSARGTPTVQGVAFDLRIPSCPFVIFEIKLPADESLSVPKGTGLLSGPHEADDAKFRLWRLHVAGRTQVELLVRRGIDASGSPQVFASTETRVQFSPEHTVYDVDAQIEVLHAPLREIDFEVDAALRPFDVSSRQSIVESWQVEPATAKSGKTLSRVKVQLREPILGNPTNLHLRLAGPRWSDQQSTLPAIDVVGAISRSDTLKLNLYPDQNLERWEPGGYRLVNSATEADGSQSLTLIDVQSDGKTVRPKFLLRSEGVDFSVKQSTRWTIEASGMSLTSEIQYDLSRGRLFSVEAKLPKSAAWRVAQVEVLPRDTMQKWSIAGGILRVELQRGITPRSDCKLIIQLQDDRDKSVRRSTTLDFPDLEPLGAQVRQETLAILADPHQRIALIESSLPPARPDATLAKEPRLQFFFASRQAPIQGKIRLVPQQAVIQAKAQQYVTLTPDAARIKSVMAIEPILGQPTEIDLYFPGCDKEPAKIEAKGAEIVGRQRIGLPELVSVGLQLAALNPVAQAGAAMIGPRGQIWRISFREPIAKAITLTTQHELTPMPLAAGEIPPALLPLDYGVGLVAIAAKSAVQRDWDIPTVVLLDAERVDGEVLVQPLGVTLSTIQTRGFESTSGPGTLGSVYSRRFRFARAGLIDAPSLRTKAIRRADDDSAQAVIDLAELVTTVDPTGNVVHDLRVSIWNWRGGEFRLIIPRDSQVIGGRLNQTSFDRMSQTSIPDGLEVLLPLLQETGAQEILLRFRLESKAWLGSLGRAVAAPWPKLPLTALRVEREWRLAPQWLPLRQEALTSFDERSPARDSVKAVWGFGDSLVAEFTPPKVSDSSEQIRLALLGAEAGLHRAGPRELMLGDALAKLMFDRAKDAANPIVLDRAALRALGLSPRSEVVLSAEAGPPFWERMGFVAVSFRGGTLLTTPHFASAMLGAQERDASLARALECGQDASGRFVAVDLWLRSESAPRSSADSANPRDDGLYTIWRPLAGESSAAEIVLVKPSHMRGLAVALAVGAMCAGLILRRFVSTRVNFGVVNLGLLFGIYAAAAAPKSAREVVLAALVVLVALLVLSYRDLLRRGASRRGTDSRSTSMRVATASLVALVIGAGAGAIAWGQDVAGRTIYVLGATPDAAARAFVRPDLLRWLDDQEKQSTPNLEGAVFLAARYSARSVLDAVNVDAEFDIVALNKDVALVIPLAGVDLLEGSELDGQAAYPVVSTAPKSGYLLTLKDSGPHRIKLRFQARPNATGDVTWSGPPTFCSSLRVAAPAKLRSLRLGKGQGTESRLRPNGSDEQILTAQLGREATVLIHGLAAPPARVAPSLHVREMYAWDLRPGNRALQGLLAFTAVGETNQIELNIPAGLEVRTVELSETPGVWQQNAIKTWRLLPRDNDRLMQIEFLQPMSGSFQILVGMTMHGSAKMNQFDLRLPLPRGATTADGLLGFRADDAEATMQTQSLGVAAVAPDVFAKGWTKSTQREIGSPLQAYSFARAAKNAGAAMLEVALVPARPRLQIDLALTAMSQTIDVAAHLSISSAEGLSLLALQVPANLVLRDVQGNDVHHWSRQGNQMHVWLVGPRKKTSIAILGWLPHSYPNAKSIAIPQVQLDGAVIDSAIVSFESASNLAIEAKGGPPLAEETAGDGAVKRFRSTNGVLPGEFRIRSQPVIAEFSSLAVAETHLEQCALAFHIRGRITHGDYPEIQLRVSRWPTAAPKLVSSVAGLKVKHAVEGSDHVWTLTVPPGTPQQISLSIKDSVALSLAATLELPELRIERGGTLTDSVVAISGAQIADAGDAKFASVRSSTKELLPWPIEHSRLRAAGSQFARLTPGAPPLRIQAIETIQSPAAHVLAARHRVSAREEDLWLHQMEWTLWSKSGLDLDVNLPEGAKLAAAFVDDQPANARQTGPESLSLLIAPSWKVRSVVVAWTYPPALEPIAGPRLASARLPGLAASSVHQEVFVPAGWSVAKSDEPESPMDAIFHDLRSELQILRLLGDDLALSGKAGQPTLTQSLQQFASLARQVQYRARVVEANAATRDAWEAKLKSLIDDWQKAAKSLGLDAARIAAEKSASNSVSRYWPLAANTGTPISWQQPFDTPEKVLDLEKTSTAKPLGSPIIVLIGIVVLCLWPPLLRTWVRLWPEQLAAVAAAAMAVGGVSIVGVLLIGIAAIGRTVAVASAVRDWVARRRAVAARRA